MSPAPRPRRHTRATLLSHVIPTLAIAAIAAASTAAMILAVAGEAP
jgi:hypothetical protein